MMDNKLYLTINIASIKMVKEENTLINIAICDDDLVFASKIEAIS